MKAVENTIQSARITAETTVNYLNRFQGAPHEHFLFLTEKVKIEEQEVEKSQACYDAKIYGSMSRSRKGKLVGQYLQMNFATQEHARPR